MKDEINKTLINNLKGLKENKVNEKDSISTLSNSMDNSNKENLSVSINFTKKQIKNLNGLKKYKKLKNFNENNISNDSQETDITSTNIIKRGK